MNTYWKLSSFCIEWILHHLMVKMNYHIIYGFMVCRTCCCFSEKVLRCQCQLIYSLFFQMHDRYNVLHDGRLLTSLKQSLVVGKTWTDRGRFVFLLLGRKRKHESMESSQLGCRSCSFSEHSYLFGIRDTPWSWKKLRKNMKKHSSVMISNYNRVR